MINNPRDAFAIAQSILGMDYNTDAPAVDAPLLGIERFIVIIGIIGIIIHLAVRAAVADIFGVCKGYIRLEQEVDIQLCGELIL